MKHQKTAGRLTALLLAMALVFSAAPPAFAASSDEVFKDIYFATVNDDTPLDELDFGTANTGYTVQTPMDSSGTVRYKSVKIKFDKYLAETGPTLQLELKGSHHDKFLLETPSPDNTVTDMSEYYSQIDIYPKAGLGAGIYTAQLVAACSENPNVKLPDPLPMIFRVQDSSRIDVTNITGLPTSMKVNESITLSGRVVPENATEKTITWAMNPGKTGATITGNQLTAKAAGEIVMVAIVKNGAQKGAADFRKTFTINVLDPGDPFVPVTRIDNLPSEMLAGASITLTGQVSPTTATNRNITWRIDNPNSTGATLSGNTLSAAAAGTIQLTAIVTDGRAQGSDYTQSFSVEVKPQPATFVPVESVTVAPKELRAGTTVTLEPTVKPDNATDRRVIFSIDSAGGTGATIDGNRLTGINEGTIRLKATVENGKAVGTAYTCGFDVAVIGGGAPDPNPTVPGGTGQQTQPSEPDSSRKARIQNVITGDTAQLFISPYTPAFSQEELAALRADGKAFLAGFQIESSMNPLNGFAALTLPAAVSKDTKVWVLHRVEKDAGTARPLFGTGGQYAAIPDFPETAWGSPNSLWTGPLGSVALLPSDLSRFHQVVSGGEEEEEADDNDDDEGNNQASGITKELPAVVNSVDEAYKAGAVNEMIDSIISSIDGRKGGIGINDVAGGTTFDDIDGVLKSLVKRYNTGLPAMELLVIPADTTFTIIPTTAMNKAEYTIRATIEATIEGTLYTMPNPRIKEAGIEDSIPFGTASAAEQEPKALQTFKAADGSLWESLPVQVDDGSITVVTDSFSPFIVLSETASLAPPETRSLEAPAGGAVLTADNAALNAFASQDGEVALSLNEISGGWNGRPAYTLSAACNGRTVTDLQGGAFSVSIPYTLREGESAGALQMVLINGGETEPVGSSYDPQNGVLRGRLTRPGVVGISTLPVPQSSDLSGHWAEDDMLFAATRGLLSPVNDAAYCPDAELTRAELAQMLYRFAGSPAPTNWAEVILPDDVDASAEYADAVRWALSCGLLTTDSTQSFRPAGDVPRQALAFVLHGFTQTIGYLPPSYRNSPTYADSDAVADWAAESVYLLSRAGLLMPRADGLFAPESPATRAELAASLHRLADLLLDPSSAGGWEKSDSGEWYYYQDGASLTGEQTIGSTACRFGADGRLEETRKAD